MIGSFPAAVRGRWRPGASFLFRVGRRTLVESLYLFTAPVIAAAGLLLVLGGLCLGAVGWLLPGGSRLVPVALTPARWFGDIERWRIAKVRSLAGVAGAGQWHRPKEQAAASDPGLWLDVAHAVVVFPVALITSVVTAVWWFAGIGAATSIPRSLGKPAGTLRPMTLYLGSGQSHLARAGRPRCSFASANTPARFGGLASRLRARPLRLAAPGIKPTTFAYPNLIADTEHWMHDPAGYRGLFPELTDLARLTAPGGGGSGHAALVRALLHLHSEVQAPPAAGNQLEAFSGVACTDGLSAANAASWPAAAAAADRHAGYFGAFYAWLSIQCARNTWTAQANSVYRGPFDHRTAAPVLVVGGTWDPATSYGNAVKVARMMPNSRLVSSDNWGHESAGTSACVDNAIFGYLIRPLAPAPKVTHCRGDVQPFA